MNVCSNFYAYMCMLNIILMLVNFGSENWSQAQGVGPDFYTFPDVVVVVVSVTSL